MCVITLLLFMKTSDASACIPPIPERQWQGALRDTIKDEDADAEDMYEEDDLENVDSYRGRSTWTPDQFGRLADSIGIDNRKGQSAAVAHIITSLKQGNNDVARKRLQALLATPGYMLDPDLAQVLVALESLLGKPLKSSGSDGGAQLRDTVYMIDTVYRDQPRESNEAEPSSQTDTRDTVYVDVVKYDTVYVPQDSASEERDLTGPNLSNDPQRQEQPRKTALDDSTRIQRMAAMAEEIASLKRRLQNPTTPTEPATITRQCYTILVSTHASRDTAEAEVKRLKRRYRRARLAISETTGAQYAVIIGYYQTPQAARLDAITVSRAVGKRCRAVATTIAEKI
jgi:hypothetical protein